MTKLDYFLRDCYLRILFFHIGLRLNVNSAEAATDAAKDIKL